MKMRIFKMLVTFVLLLSVIAVGAYAYIQHPKFGKLPEGEHLEAIKSSPNYVDGKFQNLIPTPQFTDDSSFVAVLVNNLLTKVDRLTPEGTIPSVKTALQALDPTQDTLIWLGHSSFYVQLGGKRILIDPVFSDYGAPIKYANRAFAGTTLYTTEDMPEIDYLLITHDHWDHLDYATVKALEPKVKHLISGLGMSAYFEDWGYAKEKIHEADWYTALQMEEGFTVHVLPARHYSGRLLTRNRIQWVGFALQTPERKLFFSGDSGYGPHFQEIGKRFGGFDLAVLDQGQYDKRWAYIHMNPEEAAQAAEDLQAKSLLPAHVGRFAIAKHAWDEPFQRIVSASAGKPYHLLTPMIGEPISLTDPKKTFSRWWEGVE
jgi:L-ascorbate metabolism protein UlaG (beta-lactamase superfamily)